MAVKGEYNVEYWTRMERSYLKQLESRNGGTAKVVRNHLALAALYEIMNRFDDCFLHCTKALDLSKNNFDKAEALVLMGRAYLANNEYNLAIALFLQAIELHPGHHAAIEDAGLCYKELKDFTNSEYWFKKLEHLEDCEEYAWMSLGDLFYEAKDFDQALVYYEKCLKLSNDDIEALCGKGRCLAEKKLLNAGIEVFKKAAGICPYDALPHYYLGVCYQDINDHYRALYHYTKALELDPDFAEVYNNIGKLYADFDGDIRTAISYLERGLEFTGNKHLQQMIYINLATLNNRIADYERSDYYNNKLIEDF